MRRLFVGPLDHLLEHVSPISGQGLIYSDVEIGYDRLYVHIFVHRIELFLFTLMMAQVEIVQIGLSTLDLDALDILSRLELGLLRRRFW